MQIVAINEAEAVVEPFWDPQLSELDQWGLEPGDEHGLSVSQNWCNVVFEWARRPAHGPALRMSRRCDLHCGDYDRLVLSVLAPQNAVVGIRVETDRGPREMTAPPAGGEKAELILDLAGATRLEQVCFHIGAGSEGVANGHLNWLGLQNSRRLASRLHLRTLRKPFWPKHLKDETFEPGNAPTYGLLLNAEELANLRAQHDALVADGRSSPFLAAAEAARRTPPEDLIHDHVNFWNDSRYNRQRDHGKMILGHGLNAAIAGRLTKDKSLLRLAARYALSIGMCRNWDDGFICRFPGGSFEHRCFVQSLCAYDVAGILDLAGECFTATGRDFLLRRLAEEAIGSIQYSTWKHDYIFGCNQLAWFSPGRMLALAVLHHHWPRVRPYLDIAWEELCESLQRSILPDGGYVEGPGYFRCVGRDAGLSAYLYARVIGAPMQDLIPEAMKRCQSFGEAVISTDDDLDVIPICDGRSRHDVLSQTIMAVLFPRSAWVRMLRKTLARNDGWPVNALEADCGALMMADAAVAQGMMPDLIAETPAPESFVAMPDMGPLVSQRRLGDEWVKVFIQGNRAGAGHTHEDKGSFVLEYAGDTFGCDPGSCAYSHPLSGELKHCERHNMLVPFGLRGRPRPENPIPRDVKPVGKGDGVFFEAQIDATVGWETCYRRWRRSWRSPAPDRLTITDDFELVAGDGVEFLWQTRLPVTVEGDRAVIEGRRGRAVLTAAPGRAWNLTEIPLLDGVQRRLAFVVPEKSGVFSMQVRLLPAKG